MENCNYFVNFHELKKSFLKKPILIKIKVTLMVYWKSSIILKEIKKPSGKSLRVWAKNDCYLRFEISEKIF